MVSLFTGSVVPSYFFLFDTLFSVSDIITVKRESTNVSPERLTYFIFLFDHFYSKISLSLVFAATNNIRLPLSRA